MTSSMHSKRMTVNDGRNFRLGFVAKSVSLRCTRISSVKLCTSHGIDAETKVFWSLPSICLRPTPWWIRRIQPAAPITRKRSIVVPPEGVRTSSAASRAIGGTGSGT